MLGGDESDALAKLIARNATLTKLKFGVAGVADEAQLARALRDQNTSLRDVKLTHSGLLETVAKELAMR